MLKRSRVQPMTHEGAICWLYTILYSRAVPWAHFTYPPREPRERLAGTPRIAGTPSTTAGELANWFVNWFGELAVRSTCVTRNP